MHPTSHPQQTKAEGQQAHRSWKCWERVLRQSATEPSVRQDVGYMWNSLPLNVDDFKLSITLHRYTWNIFCLAYRLLDTNCFYFRRFMLFAYLLVFRSWSVKFCEVFSYLGHLKNHNSTVQYGVAVAAVCFDREYGWERWCLATFSPCGDVIISCQGWKWSQADTRSAVYIYSIAQFLWQTSWALICYVGTVIRLLDPSLLYRPRVALWLCYSLSSIGLARCKL